MQWTDLLAGCSWSRVHQNLNLWFFKHAPKTWCRYRVARLCVLACNVDLVEQRARRLKRYLLLVGIFAFALLAPASWLPIKLSVTHAPGITPRADSQ